MPFVLLGLACLGVIAFDQLTRLRRKELPDPGFEQLGLQEKERVLEQRDTFVNSCVEKEDVWYESAYDVNLTCNNKFWSEFNEKFEKNGNVYSIKVEY